MLQHCCCCRYSRSSFMSVSCVMQELWLRERPWLHHGVARGAAYPPGVARHRAAPAPQRQRAAVGGSLAAGGPLAAHSRLRTSCGHPGPTVRSASGPCPPAADAAAAARPCPWPHHQHRRFTCDCATTVARAAVCSLRGSPSSYRHAAAVPGAAARDARDAASSAACVGAVPGAPALRTAAAAAPAAGAATQQQRACCAAHHWTSAAGRRPGSAAHLAAGRTCALYRATQAAQQRLAAAGAHAPLMRTALCRSSLLAAQQSLMRNATLCYMALRSELQEKFICMIKRFETARLYPVEGCNTARLDLCWVRVV